MIGSETCGVLIGGGGSIISFMVEDVIGVSVVIGRSGGILLEGVIDVGVIGLGLVGVEEGWEFNKIKILIINTDTIVKLIIKIGAILKLTDILNGK